MNLVYFLYAVLTHRTQVFGDFRGKIEAGETLEQAAIREVNEETGLRVICQAKDVPLEAFDYDAAGELRYHYLLIPVICAWQGGEPTAASDVLTRVGLTLLIY
jgi:8-oxo-dGTP pyrophosphatase MutT (NUDIX family)